jgi:protoporphyrinogen oxidase
VTDENVSSILKERTDTENELNVLIKTSLESMWKSELKTLSGHYVVYKKKREQIQLGEGTKPAKKTAAKKVTKVLKLKK